MCLYTIFSALVTLPFFETQSTMHDLYLPDLSKSSTDLSPLYLPKMIKKPLLLSSKPWFHRFHKTEMVLYHGQRSLFTKEAGKSLIF